jgi:hypothetical protein
MQNTTVFLSTQNTIEMHFRVEIGLAGARVEIADFDLEKAAIKFSIE